ncbi:collectin-12-like [Arapaima gigas]
MNAHPWGVPTDEDEDPPPTFRYHRFVRGGVQCGERGQDWVLKAAIALLYVLCAVLAIAVAALACKVAQRVDHVLELHRERIADMEKDLTMLGKLYNQTWETSESIKSEMEPFRSSIPALRGHLRAVTDHTASNAVALDQLQGAAQAAWKRFSALSNALDLHAAAIEALNHSLLTSSGHITSLQTDTKQLQEKLQNEVRQKGQVLEMVGHLNFTQTGQRTLLAALEQAVDETNQKMLELRRDAQDLQQDTWEVRMDAEWLTEKVQWLQDGAVNSSTLAASSSEMLEEIHGQLLSLLAQLHSISALAGVLKQNMQETMSQIHGRNNETSVTFHSLNMQLDHTEQGLDHITRNMSITGQLLGNLSYELFEMHRCSEVSIQHANLLQELNVSLEDLRTKTVGLNFQQEMLTAQLDIEVTDLSVVMQEMMMVDSKHSQLITNFTIRKGSPGPRGLQGLKGPQGPRGPIGQKGEKGDIGPQGLLGPKGQSGISGVPGNPGPKGQLGTSGSPGAKGSRGLGGPFGRPGEKGEPGMDGDVGCQGQPGPQGPQGPLGVQGPDGVPGEKGPHGATGPVGPPGPPGLPGVPAHSLTTDVPPSGPLIQIKEEIPTRAPGCPQQWKHFREKCYYFSTERVNFEEAKKNCDSRSSSMVIISDIEEQQWVQKEVAGQSFFWLGLTDMEEDTWRWVDGSLPTITKWKPGQPDNWTRWHPEGENCAGMVHRGYWNDFYCQENLGFICERDV